MIQSTLHYVKMLPVKKNDQKPLLNKTDLEYQVPIEAVGFYNVYFTLVKFAL